MGLIQPETFGCFFSSLQVRGGRWRGCFRQEEEKDQAVTDVTWASYLCSCILRVITWWTSCSISATVASGASVTQDRGTGFHLPTWIRPEHTHTRAQKYETTTDVFYVLLLIEHLCSAPLACAAELCEYPSVSRAISISWLNSRSLLTSTNSACSSLLSLSRRFSLCSTTQNTGNRLPEVTDTHYLTEHDTNATDL